MLSVEQPLMFEHELFFRMGMDCILPYRLAQKIEVEFKGVSLPCESTGGLHLTIPTVILRGNWLLL